MVCCLCCGGGGGDPCKKHHVSITWVLAILATIGVGAFLAGTVNIATAEKSTALELIERFRKFYEENDGTGVGGSDVMKKAQTTGAVLNSRTYPWTAVTKGGVSTSESYQQYFWEGVVPRGTGSTQVVQFAIVNNYEGSEAATITSPTVPLTSGGKHLSELCFVIKREKANGPYLLADTYESCYYPFKEDSNPYNLSTATANLNIKVITFGDPMIPIELYSKGTNTVEDRDVTLAPGWALPAMVIGLVLTIIFLPAVACVVCNCWSENPAVMRHIAFGIFCPCCVKHDFPVKDPLQTACGEPVKLEENAVKAAVDKLGAV